MSNIFDRQIKAANKLITKYGQLVLWRNTTIVPSSNGFKPSGQTNTDYNVYITFFPIMNVMKEFLRYMKDSNVPVGSVQGYMAAQSFDPTLKDQCIANSEVLNVKSIQKLAPNGETILYIIEFDK